MWDLIMSSVQKWSRLLSDGDLAKVKMTSETSDITKL